ncbi:aspartyl-tRNA synthetase cytoplasmic [Neolentinus lepideus HHB14362 ss-1]|uniref:aspartate--tRNA ligase n=1 Tax=Neolentinus lepideus HHB14362 ss-1 TaxID=1314782 RepID=A0A165MI52_9AGAM|nr:aspartyl-tRNA synthetase cytoplasmic [Neolentinus lepideus HHB14362 ss-1]
MSTVKRLLSKVSSIHRTSKSIANDISAHHDSEKTANGDIKAQQQQHSDHANGHAHPHGRASRSTRSASFTERKELRKEEKAEHDEVEKIARQKRRTELYEADPLKKNYGHLTVHLKPGERDNLLDIAKKEIGSPVRFRARVHHSRAISPKITFLILRHQLHTVQGVLTVEEGLVSDNMVRWAEDLHRESIVLVEGKVHAPQEGGQDRIKSTTIHEVEVKIEKLYLIAEPSTTLPFQVDDASRPLDAYKNEDAHLTRVGERTRLNHRVLDLRTPVSQSIFRIHSAIVNLFREFLISKGFTEIHSSKFQEGATESGASVFRVDYFRRNAFLAQSPQLMKQMCIAADMERVFEVGPVFRAENSNTHRHLTEFTGLDLEMTFEADYHEVMNLIDEMFLHIFKSIYRDYREEIDTVKQQFPHDDLVIPDETLKLRFADGIQLLKESGWKEEDGTELTDEDDLSTAAERRLGEIVKQKYNTDYYILDKFPAGVRPFYTMLDSENRKFSNSYDFFIRGEEILSGGQRIHLADMLIDRMREVRINPDSMRDYVDGFRWGCPPHGGGGIGLERVVMLLLKLGNIRWASLFPRDPRSFPATEKEMEEAALETAQRAVLYGPKSATYHDGKQHSELPPLENLIAKYGDATNTSWVDPAWTVWRHDVTGGAVGYIVSEGFAIAFGNPLCERDQIPQLVRAYLHFLEANRLKPVWCCIDRETEQYLAQDLGWSAIIAVAEERLNPTQVHPHDDKNFRRKIHRAERDGVKITEVEHFDEELRAAVEKRLEDWKGGRKGEQVHLTGVRPFDDMEHRRYFVAYDKDQTVCAMVVLAQLAATHGFQIKWALEFPGAPNGAIEYILWHVIRRMGNAGIRSATFGAGARDKLERADNIGGFRVRALEKTYNGLSSSFNLTNKGDFRAKFGTHQEPLYISYPKGGLGVKGIEAIMNVVKKPK